MKDREKLKKLIQIIGDLVKIEGNEWVVEDIFHMLGENNLLDKVIDNPIIDEIYEHCIKQVISKQASDFYSKFPINDAELVTKLIYDFKEMEYNRRRDRFYEFSFCLNQQIEGITNYLFDNIYLEQWQKISSKQKNEIVENFNTREKQITNTLQDVIIEKDKENNKQWSDLSKFKLVYYCMNRSPTFKLPYDFKRMRDVRQEISIARNEAHRGSDKFKWQQDILMAIHGNESKYYFKFYGFLQEFITQIEYNYSKKTMSPENKIQDKKTFNIRSANTLGDNPNLAKLSEQLKKKD